jgi:hypothetical protein
MKRFLYVVVLLVIATGASAQFVQSNVMLVNSPTSTNSGTGLEKMTTDNYGRFYIGYNPVSVNWEENEKELKKIFPMENGLTLGYMHGHNIVKSLPLYVEYGANVAWIFGKHEDKIIEGEYSLKDEFKLNMFSINVPVNLAFRLSFANNDFSITPYLGLNFRFNVAGIWKTAVNNIYEDYNGEVIKEKVIMKHKLFSSDETDLNDIDIWDIDDYGNEIISEATVGMGDNAFKRFQVGFNIGVAVNYKKLHLGFGYVTDFNKLADFEEEDVYSHCKLGVPTISLGVAF